MASPLDLPSIEPIHLETRLSAVDAEIKRVESHLETKRAERRALEKERAEQRLAQQKAHFESLKWDFSDTKTGDLDRLTADALDYIVYKRFGLDQKTDPHLKASRVLSRQHVAGECTVVNETDDEHKAKVIYFLKRHACGVCQRVAHGTRGCTEKRCSICGAFGHEAHECTDLDALRSKAMRR